MKILFTMFLVAFCSFSSFSQLTKTQTFEYLNKKFSETADLSRHYNDEMTYTVSNMEIKMVANNKVSIGYTRKFSSGISDYLEYTFDPLYITSASPFTGAYNNDAMGLIHLKFSAKIVVLKQHSNGITVINKDLIPIPFFSSEKLNAERMEKAFLHLKKLYQDSKPLDPFLN